MTEERTEYTVSVELQERLDALWASYGVLATQVRDYWDAIMEAAETIKELKATVQRLEADNRRLRHLDAMPYWSIVQVANDPQLRSWPAIQEIKAWVDAQDGDA